MSERLSRQELYDLVWAQPLRSLSARFGISDVALKKTCAKAQIPTPERGYWASKDAGKKVSKRSLPERPPAMEDEVLVAGGRNEYHYRHSSDEELLGPLPLQPVFETPIETVRDRIVKAIGTVTAPREVRVWHPVIQRLLTEDQERREKQQAWSWEKPLFDTAVDKRRLRLLNTLFVVTERFDGKASPEHDARKISLSFYRQHVTIVLNPAKRPRRISTPTGKALDNDLSLSILGGFHSDTEIQSWSDSEDLKLERQLTEIATEIVLRAEVLYRASVVRHYQWRIKQKADLEEEQRRRELESEKAERERIQRLEQARVDRLLVDAAALQQAAIIRDYVQRIRSAQSGALRVSGDDLERWSEWALTQADRIDPSLTDSFMEGFRLAYDKP